MSENSEDFDLEINFDPNDLEKDIDLPFKLLGVKVIPENMQKNMGGLKEAASFQASYSLNRSEFTVGTGSWAATVMVGDEVTIDVAVEAHIR